MDEKEKEELKKLVMDKLFSPEAIENLAALGVLTKEEADLLEAEAAKVRSLFEER